MLHHVSAIKSIDVNRLNPFTETMLIKTAIIVPSNFYCIRPFDLVRSMACRRATDSFDVLRHRAEFTFRCSVSCEGSRASIVVVLESY